MKRPKIPVMRKEEKKIKVCFVTHASNLTGASQSLLDMLSGLSDSNVEPFVLLRKKGPLEEELRKIKIPYRIIYYAQTIRSINRTEHIRSAIKRLVNGFQERRIAAFLKQEGFDIVHNNALLVTSGMKASLKAGLPYVCHIREMLEEDHGVTVINSPEMEKCIRNANACIAISDFVIGKYRKYIGNNKYYVLPDGIDTQRYYRKHRELFSSETVRILIAGRLQEMKGQLDAIKAIQKISASYDKKVELYIAGGDAPFTDYPNRIRAYVAENEMDNVHFLGFADLTELRSNCDINLMCSSSEAFGRVTVEGMLAGCLVIGADAGATPEIIRDGETGFLYEAGNTDALAECIIRAIADKDRSELIAKSGQKAALAFDSEEYAKKIFKIYEDILVCRDSRRRSKR